MAYLNRVLRVLTGLLMLVISAGVAAGQTNTGEIAGVVKDSSGGVLPGATSRPPTARAEPSLSA